MHSDNMKYVLFLDDDVNRWQAFSTWLDKFFPFPCRAIWVDNVKDCISNLESRDWDMICLDHDLGDCDKKTGYDVAKYLERRLYEDNVPAPNGIIVHTANSVGRKNIIDAVMSIKKKQKEVTVDVQSFDVL